MTKEQNKKLREWVLAIYLLTVTVIGIFLLIKGDILKMPGE